MKLRLLAGFFVISCLALLSNATLAPPDKNKKTKAVKEFKVNKGPVEKNVFERNLVQDEPLAESIIKNSGTYYKNTSVRLFDGPTLGFVTPVNMFLLLLLYHYSFVSLRVVFNSFFSVHKTPISYFFHLTCPNEN